MKLLLLSLVMVFLFLLSVAPALAAQDSVRLAAEKLFAEGEKLREEGKAESLRASITKFTEAIRLFTQAGADEQQADALYSLGVAHRMLSEYDQALDAYQRAEAIFRHIGNRSYEAQTLTSIAEINFQFDRKTEALAQLERALLIFRELNDEPRQAWVQGNLGSLYLEMGEMQRGLEMLQNALALRVKEGNEGSRATLLSNIGSAYDDLGEPRMALVYLQQALEIRRRLNDARGQAYTLSHLGSVWRTLGDLQKRLDCYQESLALFRAQGAQREMAAVLNNLGSVYDDLGDAPTALDYYQQARLLSEQLKNSSAIAATLNNIGDSQLKRGEFAQALATQQQALALMQSVQNQRGEARTLVKIGECYAKLKQFAPAQQAYEQALTILRALGDRTWEGTALTGLGWVQEDSGDTAKALITYQAALSLREAVQDRAGTADVLSRMARVELRHGKLAEARQYVETGLAIIESLRTSILSQELRASYLASRRLCYELYAEIMLRLSRQATADHQNVLPFAAAAFQMNERARARSLLEALTETRQELRADADSALLEQERALQEKINAKEMRRRTLLNVPGREQPPAQEKQFGELEREINALLQQLRELRTNIRARNPKYATITQPEPLSLTAVQKLLDQDTLLLEYFFGKDHSYLWAVSTTAADYYELPGRAEIEKTAQQLNETLRNARNQFLPGETPQQKARRITVAEKTYHNLAAALSRLLLTPVAVQMRPYKRLLIVSDGALHYIPFAALPQPAATLPSLTTGSRTLAPACAAAQCPLLLQYEIVTLPSASLLGALSAERKKAATSAAATIAVLADPVFTRQDQRVSEMARRRGNDESRQSVALNSAQAEKVFSLERSARDAGINGFARLRASRDEALTIAALVAPQQQLLALDFKASRDLVTSAALSRYRVIHFATHGLLNTQHPELSGLVLSLINEQGQEQDGFLRLHEIYNLRLGAELVVLSGCETALGREISGEGLIGLTRGFMYAGTPRVIASLWNVDDQATAHLMKKFYEQMLGKKLSPAAALRAAQMEMWQQQPGAVPYKWAAFVLQGDWH